jgi:phosphate transport system ATP-binding protein
MTETLKITARDVNVYYGTKRAIEDVSIDIATEHVTSFIGPSGCGKSTFLRALNRMNDTIPSCRVYGEIKLDGEDIYGGDMDVCSSVRASEWSFKSQTPFRNRSMKMLPTAPEFMVSPRPRAIWTPSSKNLCAALDCGMK